SSRLPQTLIISRNRGKKKKLGAEPISFARWAYWLAFSPCGRGLHRPDSPRRGEESRIRRGPAPRERDGAGEGRGAASAVRLNRDGARIPADECCRDRLLLVRRRSRLARRRSKLPIAIQLCRLLQQSLRRIHLADSLRHGAARFRAGEADPCAR